MAILAWVKLPECSSGSDVFWVLMQFHLNGTAASFGFQAAEWGQDEVIVPSLTYVAPAITTGAKPIACDIEGNHGAHARVQSKRDQRADKGHRVCPLFRWGRNIDKVLQLANRNGLRVIEDVTAHYIMENALVRLAIYAV